MSANLAPSCPHCGSQRMQRFGNGAVALVGLSGAGCMMWIPIVGWILVPVFCLIFLAGLLGAVLPSGRVLFRCLDCRNLTRVPKAELRR